MPITEHAKKATTAHTAIHRKAKQLSADELARREARADAAVAQALQS